MVFVASLFLVDDKEVKIIRKLGASRILERGDHVFVDVILIE